MRVADAGCFRTVAATPGETVADVATRAGLVASGGEARRLAAQGGLVAAAGPDVEPLAEWPRIDPDAPLVAGWWLLSRGRRWSMGHLVRVEVA